jgi:hypothetical protein
LKTNVPLLPLTVNKGFVGELEFAKLTVALESGELLAASSRIPETVCPYDDEQTIKNKKNVRIFCITE